jgi:hypothetical protein
VLNLLNKLRSIKNSESSSIWHLHL